MRGAPGPFVACWLAGWALPSAHWTLDQRGVEAGLGAMLSGRLSKHFAVNTSVRLKPSHGPKRKVVHTEGMDQSASWFMPNHGPKPKLVHAGPWMEG